MYPYTAPTGYFFERLSHEEALDTLLEIPGYRALCAERDALRAPQLRCKPLSSGRHSRNAAVAKLELVGTPRGPDCGYDPNVIMADVDKSAERRENRASFLGVSRAG